MQPHHESIFTYTLTRPYPFRLYTPIALLLFVILLVPVTFINVATAGFELGTVTSLDPNVTTSHTEWNSWLSGVIGNLQATCQPAIIPSNAQMFTNNSALTYTMVNALNYTFNDTEKVLYQLPSLANQLNYMNNPLQDCATDEVHLAFDVTSKTPIQIAQHRQGLKLSSYVSCGFQQTAASFLVEYEYVLPSFGFYDFPGHDNFGNSSLLLGEALLQTYWLYTAYKFYEQNMLRQQPYDKAWLNLSIHLNDQPFVTNEISSSDFFDASAHFLSFNSSGGMADPTIVKDVAMSDLIDSNNDTILPSIWAPVDVLAKVFRDTIMADLGQASPGNEKDREVGGNILTNPSYLELYTKNFTQMRKTLEEAGPGWTTPSRKLPTDPFTASANTSQYQLKIEPSVLGMSYICQVPQLKPSSSLFFSVLIADIVIIGALWHLFQFISDYLLVRKYPERFPSTHGTGKASMHELEEMESSRAGHSYDRIVNAEDLPQSSPRAYLSSSISAGRRRPHSGAAVSNT